ncbi:MAG: PAS domain-containing protein [Deltaproteobacteria bacterium]
MSRSPEPVDLLQAAVETWCIGTYAWEQESARFTASALCYALYGWPSALRITAQALWDTVHPDDQISARQAFEASLDPAGSGRTELVHRVLHPDGKVLWLQHRAQTHFEEVNGQRRARQTIGSVLDVTERRNIELELRRTETRFEEAVRAAQFGIFEHNHLDDPDAENMYWSPRMREIFGLSDGPGSTASLIARIHPDDVDALHDAVGRAHDPKGNGYYDVEHRYEHPVSGQRWLLTRSSTYFGEVGGRRVPVRTVGAMLDITARRASEQEHEQRAQILDATVDFVAMAEPGGKLLYLNRAAREFLGIGPIEDVCSRSLHAAYPADALQHLLADGMLVASREGVWSGELDLLHQDGTRVPMSHVLLCHRGRDGQVTLFSTIARDVSRERQLEETMRQAQKMEAVGRLAGGIAHDFNNILCAVLSFAHVAVREIGPEGRGYAELLEIIGASERAAALTQQLLSFSRKQVLRPRVVEVGEILTRLGPMIGRLVGEQIEVTLSLASDPVHVKVDPTHLEQVLLNLAINARDAMPEGGHLIIECRVAEVDAALGAARGDLLPGRYAVIAVSDDGAGMSSEARARVFEPFFTTKSPGRGTGLGLATVFGIVKQSGGGMYVESQLGRGSTFEAYVPSTDDPLSQSAPVHRVSYAPGCGRVLVSEDDAAVRRVVVAVLQRAGYSVLAAPGAWEALRLAAESDAPIDLLITDVVMPGINGRALAQRLSQSRPEMAVLYMSGYSDQVLLQDGVLDAGIHLLSKPFTPERLLELVTQVLSEARARREVVDSAQYVSAR